MKSKFILAGLLLLSLIVFSIGAILPALNQNSNKNAGNNTNPQNINPQNIINTELVNTATIKTLTSTTQNSSSTNKLVLFYGNGCPHCALVEAYLKENPPKFNLEMKEVYYNKINQQELVMRAKTCGLPQNEIGVPFLWTGSGCIIGDQPIINYFKQLSK
jgi:glutaredoxin